MIAIKLIVISFRIREKNIDHPQWEREKKENEPGNVIGKVMGQSEG